MLYRFKNLYILVINVLFKKLYYYVEFHNNRICQLFLIIQLLIFLKWFKVPLYLSPLMLQANNKIYILLFK
jgi:hypothetical protein